ncbi:MAG: Bro-N domain-containing protein [Nanoarchaeota archaeon]|nr:Bro-N domain-containing protein [Nanoarchaeota archaeon]
MNALVVFQGKRIRRTQHNNEWYFSVVDIIGALTDSVNPTDYLKKLRKRDLRIGSYIGTNCPQVAMPTGLGKLRNTLAGNTKDIFRLIQSIPSKKAEPFKLWLAKVGYERVQEIENPELAQERMKEIYEKKGYSKSWIDKRLRGIAVRQDLTDEWKKRNIKSEEDFSILTAEISKASFNLTPSEYKKLKGLDKENLRDHMNDLELIFTMLGEASTSEIEKVHDPKTFPQHKKASRDGGKISKHARLELESKTKRKVITNENYLKIPEKEKRKQIKNNKH